MHAIVAGYPRRLKMPRRDAYGEVVFTLEDRTHHLANLSRLQGVSDGAKPPLNAGEGAVLDCLGWH